MVAASKAFFFSGRLMVTKTMPSVVESICTRSSFASGAGSATSGWAMLLISAASASVTSRASMSAGVFSFAMGVSLGAAAAHVFGAIAIIEAEHLSVVGQDERALKA